MIHAKRALDVFLKGSGHLNHLLEVSWMQYNPVVAIPIVLILCKGNSSVES